MEIQILVNRKLHPIILKEVLPLGEIPLYRHNGQIFNLDREVDGKTLISVGDSWLLPYREGRYMGVINASESVKNEKL